VERKIGPDRFFSVGIGSAPNSFLMTKLADFGKGAYTYIGKISEVKQKMLELLYKLESPAMTNIRIDFPSGSESEQGFGVITDLYAGETISAIFKTKSLPSTLTIEGDTVNGKFTKDIDITPANESKGLDVLWARRKIESLTNLYYFDRSSAQQKAIRNDITSIALKHHLVSKFTSLVAVDVTPTRPEEEMIVTQPLFNKFKALIEPELAELRVPAAIQMNQVPNMAYTSANTWKCNPGYIKSGNSCKKIIGQINTQLATSVNASRTATNSELLIYLGLVIMLLAAILRRRQNA
jgi:Ca-activated chloride channel family protein